MFMYCLHNLTDASTAYSKRMISKISVRCLSEIPQICARDQTRYQQENSMYVYSLHVMFNI